MSMKFSATCDLASIEKEAAGSRRQTMYYQSLPYSDSARDLGRSDVRHLRLLAESSRL